VPADVLLDVIVSSAPSEVDDCNVATGEARLERELVELHDLPRLVRGEVLRADLLEVQARAFKHLEQVVWQLQRARFQVVDHELQLVLLLREEAGAERERSAVVGGRAAAQRASGPARDVL
jgi:hypothetical protein